MIASVTFVLNGMHDADRDWGYDPANVLAVEIADPGQYEVLYSIALRQPGVESLSGSRDHIGRNATYGNVEIDGKLFETGTAEPNAAGGAVFHRYATFSWSVPRRFGVFSNARMSRADVGGVDATEIPWYSAPSSATSTAR